MKLVEINGRMIDIESIEEIVENKTTHNPSTGTALNHEIVSTTIRLKSGVSFKVKETRANVLKALDIKVAKSISFGGDDE